jgi:hypothetical protein
MVHHASFDNYINAPLPYFKTAELKMEKACPNRLRQLDIHNISQISTKPDNKK